MNESCLHGSAGILLDTNLVVLDANPVARRLLEGNPRVLALRQQRLHAPGAVQALTRCLASAAGGKRAAMCLPRLGQQALTLRADRVPSAGGWRILVSLRDPELDLPDPALLQDLFGLTPTEALVAAALAQGLDGGDIARTMGVQPNTVQSHVKRILLKTGTRRQPQLVSLILRSVAMPTYPSFVGPGLAQTGNDAVTAAGHSPPQHEAATCG